MPEWLLALVDLVVAVLREALPDDFFAQALVCFDTAGSQSLVRGQALDGGSVGSHRHIVVTMDRHVQCGCYVLPSSPTNSEHDDIVTFPQPASSSRVR